MTVDGWITPGGVLLSGCGFGLPSKRFQVFTNKEESIFLSSRREG